MTDPRAAFEAFARRELKQDAGNWRYPSSGEYVYLESEWKAWQAAIKHEREACEQVCAELRSQDHVKCDGSRQHAKADALSNEEIIEMARLYRTWKTESGGHIFNDQAIVAFAGAIAAAAVRARSN